MTAKNPAAVALGRLGGKARLRKMTADQRSDVARQGGKARFSDMTAGQRKAVARRAAAARWAKAGKPLKKTNAAVEKLAKINEILATKPAKHKKGKP
jgi:hypothetical protein